MVNDSIIGIKFAQQLPRNLVANVLYLAINVLIGIWLAPYFISTLGVAGYGIIPLATSISGYVGLLSDSLNAAVSRFLTVDLHQENYKKANTTFNTALIGTAGIILILVPIAFVVSLYSPIFFQTGSYPGTEVILLFLGVLGAFLIRSWGSNFMVSLFAYNRLDIQNLINAVSLFVQVGLIVALFTIFSPKLSYIGLAYFVAAIVTLIIAIIASKKINPHLSFDIHSFDRNQFKEISGMGWWVIVNNIGSLLFLQIDLIIVNKIFGPTINGEYALVLVWATLLRSLAATLAGILTPMYFSYFAKGKTQEIITVSKSAVKLMGLGMALPIGFICGLAPQLLTVWVGPQFSQLSMLMWVLVFPLVINLAVLPLFAINVSYNKVAFPGIVTIGLGILNVALAIGLATGTNLGFYGVAVAGAVVLTMKNALFTPWYAARVMDIPRRIFLKDMIIGVFGGLLVAIVALLVGYYLPISSIISIIVAGLGILILYSVIVWHWGLDSFEKKLILSYIPDYIVKDTP